MHFAVAGDMFEQIMEYTSYRNGDLRRESISVAKEAGNVSVVSSAFILASVDSTESIHPLYHKRTKGQAPTRAIPRYLTRYCYVRDFSCVTKEVGACPCMLGGAN